MRPMPPSRMTAVNRATISPITQEGRPKEVAKAEEMELDCTILPAKARARMISTAKTRAIHLPSRRPTPRSI